MHHKRIKTIITPFFWYLLFTVFVPLVNQKTILTDLKFVEHAVFVVVVPALFIVMFYLLWYLIKMVLRRIFD